MVLNNKRPLGEQLKLKKGVRRINIWKLQNIYMRDPFIYTDNNRKLYFLYGTTMDLCDGVANVDPYFEVYVSNDLKNFEGPYVAFEPKEGFWGVKQYWAPEVFKYRNKYYMFATFKGGIGKDRGTGILVAEQPEGPYRDHSKGHVTLQGNECLDGTFFLDTKGKPWIIFCHEWTQIYFGTIKALPLSEDLTKAISQDAITIVDTKKDQLPWIRHMEDPRVEKKGYLTDAPFVYRRKDGGIDLLWSSYAVDNFDNVGSGGYVTAICTNVEGILAGKWKHRAKLLLDENTGHSALFYDLEGELRLISHGNDTIHGEEHPVIYYVKTEPVLKVNKREGI